jgi:hypothetical protein
LKLLADFLIRRIDHQPAPQVTNRFSLETERKVDRCKVPIEVRIEEFFLRRGPAQLERLIEPSLGDPQTKAEIGPISGTGGIDFLRRPEVLERHRVIVVAQRFDPTAKVLVSGKARIHEISYWAALPRFACYGKTRAESPDTQLIWQVADSWRFQAQVGKTA